MKQGVLGCIGNTPLVRIKSLSDATGCDILAKAEFLNPGGSIKDRIALHMVQKAAASGSLSPGALITEATAGSTGVSLAMVAAACGYKCASHQLQVGRLSGCILSDRSIPLLQLTSPDMLALRSS